MIAEEGSVYARSVAKEKEPTIVEHEATLSLVHELQAPLTGLRARIENAVRAPWCGPDCRATLESCLDDLRRASLMIHDLLLLERAQTAPTPPRSAIRLEELAAKVLRDFIPSAEAKGISLAWDGVDAATISGNPEELRRILANLLDNAVRYANEGGTIRVRLTLEGGCAELRVIDNGPGILPEHQARVFERFYQIDRRASRETGGVGLGLAIARSLAERNKGQLELTSTPGEGSIFLLRIPLAEATS